MENKESLPSKIGHTIEKTASMAVNMVDNLSRAATYNKLGESISEIYSTLTESNRSKTAEEKIKELDKKLAHHRQILQREYAILADLERSKSVLKTQLRAEKSRGLGDLVEAKACEANATTPVATESEVIISTETNSEETD